jgi:ABC-type lipoprotein release transport system permease subunit
MSVVWAWLRLDLRRRWQSLAVLTLLIVIAGGTVVTALAGARRGASALDRIQKNTLPLTSVVLPQKAGFDWAPIAALPEVAAVSPFLVDYALNIEGIGGDPLEFPVVGPAFSTTIEKPIIFSGRAFNVNAPDEAVVTRQFVAKYHKGVGSTVVIDLPTSQEISEQVDGTDPSKLTGPKVTVKIVGVVESLWLLDGPGSPGGLQLSPGLVAKYPANTLGDLTDPDNPNFDNAFIRLRGGEAAIPQLRDDVARITGRSDIDIWDIPAQVRDQQRHLAFEARCLVAFAIAAFIAALFLVGQAIARYAAASTSELQTLRAIGLTPRQSIVTAAAGPAIVGTIGSILAVAAAYVASNWMPIGTAAFLEPSPGFSFDWVVMGPGIAVIIAAVTGGAVAAAALALSASRRGLSNRRSAVATTVARAGVGVSVIVGTRFALETGRGKTAVPVRPALIGAVIGVLGIIAAFTFSQGVSDAADHPERFGVTYQLADFAGYNDQDFAPTDQVIKAVTSNPNVTGFDDAKTAVATGPHDNSSVSLYEWTGGDQAIPVVLTSGRVPQAADEVVLGKTTLAALRAHVGDRVPLTGSKGTATYTIVGEGFVPAGPHNEYSDGGWLTPAGYDAIFTGFKYRIELVTLRPRARGANAGDVLAAQVVAANPDLKGISFTTPEPIDEISQLREVRILPIVLGIFLALLAIGAVGHALATAVRRRSHDLAVLRALGLTQWQCRWVVITQATVLALVGLIFGVPLGLAVGRSVWRLVADYTPVQYVPPIAVWALLVIAPAALVIANILAAWPGQRAARLRIAHILRTE